MLSNYLPEGRNLIYCSHSNTMLVWGSCGLSPENFLEPNGLQCQKMPLHKEIDMNLKKESGMKGTSCPTWKRLEGSAVPLPPSIGTPEFIIFNFCIGGNIPFSNSAGYMSLENIRSHL